MSEEIRDDPREDRNPLGDETRREFLSHVAAAGAGIAAAPMLSAQTTKAATPTPETIADLDLKLTINGKPIAVAIDPRVTLLDLLRERLGLFGTKQGCDQGACGACTVLVDNRRVNSCLTLALSTEGKSVTTVEGLADETTLHPVQKAFIAHDGFQCGYCTPGQICSAVGLLNEGVAKTEAEIRDWMSGNLCRCGAYPNIIAAIRDVIQHQSA